MGWLKRVFGSTDAMAEARAEAARDDGGAQTTASRPAGWGEVETSQEGDDIVIAMPTPGLDPDSIRLEPQGSSLRVQAKGSGSHGEHISLNEPWRFPREAIRPPPPSLTRTDGWSSRFPSRRSGRREADPLVRDVDEPVGAQRLDGVAVELVQRPFRRGDEP
jgi:hypothetical protein